MFALYMTKTLAEDAFGISLVDLDGLENVSFNSKDGYELSLGVRDTGLNKGGQNQIAITLYSCESVLRFLADSLFVSKIRIFNLNLIKRGVSPWPQSHCLDLADGLIEPDDKHDAEIKIIQDGYGYESLSSRFWAQFFTGRHCISLTNWTMWTSSPNLALIWVRC